MSARNVYVNGYLTEIITYDELWRDFTVGYDEAPWSCYETIVTIECAKGGNGQCDGSADIYECECVCHGINWGLSATIRDIERFHEKMWKSQPEDFDDIYEEFSGNV